MIINPDYPFQAMKQVDILPLDDALTSAVVGLGDCTRLGSYTVDVDTGTVTPIELGNHYSRVYNLYEFTIARYNEKQHLIDPNFVDKLGFSSIRFFLRDVAHSDFNDNIKYQKRLLDDYMMIVNTSEYDGRVNVIGLDSPWAMYTSKKRESGPVDVTSNTITVDTLDTPNVLDQDISYDAWPTQQSRDVNSNDEYYPQDYQTIDGEIVRKQVGISGYDIDLDIYCLRTLTVTPTTWPYVFSIADFNSAYNTNYVGIRNLIVNGSSSSSPTCNRVVFEHTYSSYSIDINDTDLTAVQINSSGTFSPTITISKNQRYVLMICGFFVTEINGEPYVAFLKDVCYFYSTTSDGSFNGYFTVNLFTGTFYYKMYSYRVNSSSNSINYNFKFYNNNELLEYSNYTKTSVSTNGYATTYFRSDGKNEYSKPGFRFDLTNLN